MKATKGIASTILITTLRVFSISSPAMHHTKSRSVHLESRYAIQTYRSGTHNRATLSNTSLASSTNSSHRKESDKEHDGQATCGRLSGSRTVIAADAHAINFCGEMVVL